MTNLACLICDSDIVDTAAFLRLEPDVLQRRVVFGSCGCYYHSLCLHESSTELCPVCGKSVNFSNPCNVNKMEQFYECRQKAKSSLFSKFSEKLSEIELEDTDDLCELCGESFLEDPNTEDGSTEIIFAICGHYFHYSPNCLKGYLKKRDACPICKKKLELSKPYRISSIKEFENATADAILEFTKFIDKQLAIWDAREQQIFQQLDRKEILRGQAKQWNQLMDKKKPIQIKKLEQEAMVKRLKDFKKDPNRPITREEAIALFLEGYKKSL